MEVMQLQEKEDLAWDEYVQNTPLATPFHLVGWKRIMEKTYGYRSHYLVAKEAGRIEGVLPLSEVKVGFCAIMLPACAVGSALRTRQRLKS